jgi:uncharacterized damage-inducible protein DinB
VTAIAKSVTVALFHQNTWANLQLIDACAALPAEQLDLTAPGTFGTIRHTLTHLVANEERYLALLSGQPTTKPIQRGERLTLPELRARAEAAGAGLAREAARVGMDDTVTEEYQGQMETVPAYIVLTQALQHGAEHRGHIATILSQHGITPPALDGWAYGAAAG